MGYRYNPFTNSLDSISLTNQGDVNDVFIDSSGLVGIGTSSPSSYNSAFRNLVVANTSGFCGITVASADNKEGTYAFADGTSGADTYRGYLQYNHTNNYLRIGVDGSEAARFDSAGQLYSVPTYNNTAASSANVFVTSSGNFGRSTSSAKYKTDIETIENSYSDALLDCRPVWYRSTSELDNPDYGWWGFIAEEVAEIDPRLVFWKTVDITYDEKGYVVETPCEPEPEGVAYDRFVPHLLNLIKRQQQAIETLEAKVAALEGG